MVDVRLKVQGVHPTARVSSSYDRSRTKANFISDTSHVPCKFYKQGQCQAGAACPFRHSDQADICKYFQKGNCKFGMRCANEHITGDGKRVNKSAMLNGQGPGMMGGARAVPMGNFMGMPQDPYTMPQMMPGHGLHSGPDDFNGPASWKNAMNLEGANLGSHPGSMFGSPPGDGRLPMSPIQKGLSVMDVPLPASFDSSGISHFAKAGPFAASVPTRFGLETSPPSSLPRAVGESNVLRNLRSSAFGDEGSGMDKTMLASSPPITSGIDFSGRRFGLHSDRFASKPNTLSMSLGTRAPLRAPDDWDTSSFGYEEDMVPNSLTDLLTPQEKMRRLSRSNVDDDSRLSQHLMGLGSEPSSKVGSPSLGVSPSRYSGIFARQKGDNISDPSGSIGNSAIMSFGHVGSPLRNSYLSDSLSNNKDGFLNSPSRQASMSMISQQLQRTKLQSRTASEEALSGSQGASRTISATASMASPSLTSTTKSLPIPGNRFDRTISSSSMARSDKIDEELTDPAGELFLMDDPEDDTATTGGALSGDRRPHPFKRDSGGRWAIGKASPRLGPIGGQRTTSSGSLLGGLSSSLGKGDGSPWNS